MENFKFHYDSESDVLYIQNADREVEESTQSAEDIIIDLDKNGKVIGIEILYASEFFALFNREIDKSFLNHLEDASLQYKEYRNNLFVVLLMKSKGKVISQIMPPLRKSEYSSPLVS